MKRRFYRVRDLGAPISCGTFLDERFTYVDGKLTMYTTGNGTPCILNRYNLDDDRLEDSIELPGSQNCWSHGIDSQGRLYIAPQDKAKLFRYTPESRTLEDLGPIMDETAAYQISFDEEDCVYLGTFPRGMIVRYDPTDGKFTSYGTLAEGQSYVHSLFYDRGYLYAGTAGQGAKLFRVDARTGDKTEIPLPHRLNPALAENLYTLTRVGRLAFLYLFYEGGRRLLIYDLDAERWLDEEVPGFGGLYVSPLINGKIYFSVEEVFWSFDPATRALKSTGLPAPAQGKGYGCIRPEGADHDVLVALNHGGLILMFVDFETGDIRRLPMRERLRGGRLTLTAIEQGPGRELYLGAYMGSKGAAYHLDTGQFRGFALDQAEGMVRAGNRMYFGVYPGGRVYRCDSLTNSDQPELIHVIGEEQDRPFVMRTAIDGKLYLGTVPGYNRLGGAVTVYDPAAEEWKVFRGLVPDQSVCGLEIRDGLLYGATSVWGGLGIEPTQCAARLFCWDTRSERLLRTEAPDIPGLDGLPDKLGGLSFGPDGLLWCVGRLLRRGVIFAVDPENFRVVKSIALDCRKALNPWRPTYLCWAGETLYTNVDGVLELDPVTLEYRRIVDEQAGQLVLGEDGWLYYGAGPFLRRIEWDKEP